MNYLVLERFQSDRKIYTLGDIVEFDDDKTAAVLVADGLIEKIKSKPENQTEKSKSGKSEQTEKPAEKTAA
jgi:hypothetical protein